MHFYLLLLLFAVEPPHTTTKPSTVKTKIGKTEQQKMLFAIKPQDTWIHIGQFREYGDFFSVKKKSFSQAISSLKVNKGRM